MSPQNKKIKVNLWRQTSLVFGLKTDEKVKQLVFPSARQSLTYALKELGLKRSDRVALPEWSSHCLISAVGKVATPIPMREVVEKKIPVKAVIFYEQWGWPIDAKYKKILLKRFKKSILVIDRVDSADLKSTNHLSFLGTNKQIDLISLSKILGLAGGGLLKINNKYIKFNENEKHGKILKGILHSRFNRQSDEVLELCKSNLQVLRPELISWLNKNNLFSALNLEYQQRKKIMKIILESPLANSWEEWMKRAVQKGAAPSLIPLFRGYSKDDINKITKKIAQELAIETQSYHFNWSGNPLKPKYELCLAFPCNSLIKNIEYILEILSKY